MFWEAVTRQTPAQLKLKGEWTLDNVSQIYASFPQEILNLSEVHVDTADVDACDFSGFQLIIILKNALRNSQVLFVNTPDCIKDMQLEMGINKL